MKRLGRAFAAVLLASPITHAASGAADPRDQPIVEACGPGDDALARVASLLALERAGGASLPETDEIERRVRLEGGTAPNVRAIAFPHAEAHRDALPDRVHAFAASLPSQHACGVGSAKNGDGEEVVVALAAPTLATMDALPKSIRPGAWVTVRATIPDATDARLVVLGPSGAPRSVPRTFDAGVLIARFAADHAGEWLVQVVADRDGGPRPVLEALTTVGSTAKKSGPPIVPGDDATGSDDALVMRAMIDAARASESRRGLVTDDALAKLAAAHARSMAKRNVLAHDDGDGDPGERAARSGIHATEIGENVAHAASPRGAHRALWASPSHRENLLSPRFHRVGVGTARGDDGTLWVAELFAD